MAAYTSVMDGDWSNAATWGGGGVPGDGDTATIDHNVKIDGDITVGTATGATTDAIRIEHNAKLYWENPPAGDYTLTLRGRIYIAQIAPAQGEFEIGTQASPIPANRTAIVEWDGAHGYKNYNGGILTINGYPAYHMASESSHFAELTANAAAGAGVTLTLDKDVDWEVGDTIWISTGGTTNAPTNNEKTTIATKVSANEYTANLANNHFGNATEGDVVHNATRNVIFRGQNGVGFSWYGSDHSAVVAASYFDINWSRWEYSCLTGTGVDQAALCIRMNYDNGVETRCDPYFHVSYNAFDSPATTGNAARVFYFYYVGFGDMSDTQFRGNSSYGFGVPLRTVNWVGLWRMDETIAFEVTDHYMYDSSVPNNSKKAALVSNNFYITGDGNTDIHINSTNNSPVVSLNNFMCANFGYGLEFTDDVGVRFPGMRWAIQNGRIYHILWRGSAITFNLNSSSVSRPVYIINVKIYDCYHSAIQFQNLYYNKFYIKNCSIDYCSHSEPHGAVRIVSDSRFIGSTLWFENCTFGMNVQNDKYNFNMNEGGLPVLFGNSRMVFVNCDFKVPTNPAGGYNSDWWYPESIWIATGSYDYFGDWRWLCRISESSSMEFLDCRMYDATDTDKWPTDFPNTTAMGYATGGAQIHIVDPSKESAGYIDGTYRRKILAFLGTNRMNFTRRIPTPILVESGETITVKLSFKKNISQNAGDRPRVHLEGCGIYEYTEMSDAVNTWEEVTVSGTATMSGTVLFYISGRGVPYSGGVPTRPVVTDYHWSYPYEQGDSHNLILYADGYSLTRS